MQVRVAELSHCYPRRRHGVSEPPSQDRGLALGSLHVASGSRCCVVGPSGIGKSTLLHVLAGVLRPTAGKVWLDDVEIFRLKETERDRLRGGHIGCVFQSLSLLEGLSVLENLRLAQRLSGSLSGSSGAEEDFAEEVLRRLGMWELRAALPRELSGGERQRVAIARAACKQPALLLVDEPTSSLDDTSAESVAGVLLELSRGVTLIVATHDIRLKRHFKDAEVFELRSGAGGAG